MENELKIDEELDVTGLVCPRPMVMTMTALKKLKLRGKSTTTKGYDSAIMSSMRCTPSGATSRACSMLSGRVITETLQGSSCIADASICGSISTSSRHTSAIE